MDAQRGRMKPARLQMTTQVAIGPCRYLLALSGPNSDDPQYVQSADRINVCALQPLRRLETPVRELREHRKPKARPFNDEC